MSDNMNWNTEISESIDWSNRTSKALDWNIRRHLGWGFILTHETQRDLAAYVASTELAERRIVVPILEGTILDLIPWPDSKDAFSYSLRREDFERLMDLVSTTLPIAWRQELDLDFQYSGDGDEILCQLKFNLYPPDRCGLPIYRVFGEPEGIFVSTDPRESYEECADLDGSPFSSLEDTMMAVRQDVLDYLHAWGLKPARPARRAKG